jgi:hypothetical protein
MEKDCNVRNLCPCEPAKQELVDEYFGETILATGLYGPDHLNGLALFYDQVLLEAHQEIGVRVSLHANLNWNLECA